MIFQTYIILQAPQKVTKKSVVFFCFHSTLFLCSLKSLKLVRPILWEADGLQAVQEGVVVQVVQLLTGVILDKGFESFLLVTRRTFGISIPAQSA